jgi:tetraacyldisaccharide 4'-kinase
MRWQIFLHNLINYIWYKKNYFYILLLPFSCIYFIIIHIRLYLYKSNILVDYKPNKPVVVVGNITVGGTGKTPLVIYLAKLLIRNGIRPGIISRGYGRKSGDIVTIVNSNLENISIDDIGDEIYLLVKNLSVPIVIADNRAKAAEVLSKQDIDIILSDDGLQHYALRSDLEILVIDGDRMLGNGMLLPAGPLREPDVKISAVDFVIINSSHPTPCALPPRAEDGRTHYLKLVALTPIPLERGWSHSERVRENTPLYEDATVHAVAGIGNPERFFAMLEGLGFKVIRHSFPDHYKFTSEDLNFADNLPVIMTEKDAVKCTNFSGGQHWYLPVQAELSDDFTEKFLSKLQNLLRSNYVR